MIAGPAAEAIALTLNPLAGTEIILSCVMLAGRMNELGTVGAPSNGNTNVGVNGGVAFGAVTTHTCVEPEL